MFWTKSIGTFDKRLSLDEARRRSRILVIDDDPLAFPCKLLEAEGYNMTYWEFVKSLAPLEQGEFDIIVLDIHGITTDEQSTDGGLGVLAHIKRYNPAQLVVAYSQKKYDFKQADFWRLADDYLGKPSPLITCKQKIDTLLRTKFSIDYYWNTLVAKLREQEIPQDKIRKLERVMVKSVKSRVPPSTSDFIHTLKFTRELASIAAVIAGIIIKLSSP